MAGREPLSRAAAMQWARQQVDRLDARLLLEFAAQCRPEALIAYPEVLLTLAQWEAFQTLVVRRAAGEPLAYLVGEAGFYGHQLAVSPDVLVPRPETEDLVDWALMILQGCRAPVIADLGTGSGAIALALAHARHLITPDAPQSHIPAEHIAVRVSDLIAEAWTVDRIAVAAGVPTRVISDLASLTVGKLRSYRLDPVHAGRIVDLYRLEAVA